MPLYVIRYDTWTVEETDVHDPRDPKFATELEAEETIKDELSKIIDLDRVICEYKHFYYMEWLESLKRCQQRIQKLKQQSGNLQK